MGIMQNSFLQQTGLTLVQLSQVSGQSYDTFRLRKGKFSVNGRAFWYYLTGNPACAPQQEEKSIYLELERKLLQQPKLLQILQDKHVESPLLKEIREIPDAHEIEEAMVKVGQWNPHFLLCKKSYQPLFEGGKFTNEDIEETKQLIDELNKRLYLAAHQNPTERHKILSALDKGISTFYTNADLLGAEEPLIATGEMSDDLVEQILKN